MKLQIRISKEINWMLLLLLMFRVFSINEEIFFLLSIAYLLVLVLKSKKIYAPRISGLTMYIGAIISSTIIGIMFYPIRNIIRDLFYVLPTVTWIFIGYYLCKYKTGKNRILKTIYIYAGINSTLCFIKFILNPLIDYESLRVAFGVNVYDIGFILPIMIYSVFLYKKEIFGKIIDRYLIIVMIFQVIMSLGRIAILIPVVILFTLLSLELKGKERNLKSLKILFFSAIGVISIFIVIYSILPMNAIESFTSRLLNSFQEIQYKQEINSTVEAMNNWRAYEMKVAINQWKSSNILIKILGEGLGKGIIVDYIPHNWGEKIVGNDVPLLHNGFYTLLVKGGIFCTFSLVWLFIGNIIKSFKLINTKLNNRSSAVIIIAISVGGVLNTYVVRGPVQQGAFLIWAILLGCMSCEINKQASNSFS